MKFLPSATDMKSSLWAAVLVLIFSAVSCDIYEDHSSRAFFPLPRSIKGLDVTQLKELHENIDDQFWGTLKKLLLVESPVPLDHFLENYHQIWLPWQWIGFSIIKDPFGLGSGSAQSDDTKHSLSGEESVVGVNDADSDNDDIEADEGIRGRGEQEEDTTDQEGYVKCSKLKTCRLQIHDKLKALGIEMCFHFKTALVGQCVFPWKREVCDRHQVISCHPFPHLAESIFEVLPDAQDEDERNEDGTDEKIRPEQRNSNAANGLRERPRSGGSKEQQSSNGNNYPTRTTPNRPRPYLERDYYRGYKYPRYENALAAQVAHQKNRPSGSKGGSGDVAIRPHETENVAPRFPPRQNNFLGMHPVFILPDGKRVRLPSSQSLAQIREDIATEIQEAPNADLFIADVIGSVRSVVESIVIFIGEGIDGLTEMVREAGSNLMQGTSGEIWRPIPFGIAVSDSSQPEILLTEHINKLVHEANNIMPGSGEAVKSKPTSTNSNVWVDEDPVSAKDVTDCFKEERDEYLYGLFDPIDLQNAFESRGASTCVVAEAIGRLFGSEKVPETTQGKLRKAIARAIESFGTDKPILEEVEVTGRQNSYGIHSKPRQFTVAQASIHFLRMLEDNLREASSSLLPEEEPEADQYNPADDVLKRRMDKKVDMVKVGVKDKVAAVTQHRATSGILGFLRGILSFKTSFLKQTMRVPLWIKSKVSGLGQEGEDVQEDNDSIKKDIRPSLGFLVSPFSSPPPVIHRGLCRLTETGPFCVNKKDGSIDPCIDMGISPTDFVAACSEDEVLVALNTLYGDEEGEEKREDMTKETEGGLFLSVKTKKETKASTKDTEVAITPESGVGPRAYPGSSSSSWPWFKSSLAAGGDFFFSSGEARCKCLGSDDVYSLTRSRVDQPCSQPVPWCYVGEDSQCLDSSRVVYQRVQLKWSQMACKFEAVALPHGMRRFHYFRK